MANVDEIEEQVKNRFSRNPQLVSGSSTRQLDVASISGHTANNEQA
jgi:hypothetical protein